MIKQGLRCLKVRNALAYYAKTKMTSAKMFSVLPLIFFYVLLAICYSVFRHFIQTFFTKIWTNLIKLPLPVTFSEER
jgi:hypothetical protein